MEMISFLCTQTFSIIQTYSQTYTRLGQANTKAIRINLSPILMKQKLQKPPAGLPALVVTVQFINFNLFMSQFL
jgi:hypothetical protein